MNETADQKFLFAEFEVDAVKRRLVKNGRTLPLNPKAFDLLLVLIENRAQVVSKEQLLDKVWANQFVEENNLTVHISALRKIFGEKKGEHQFIVTIPGRGYKFVADVRLQVDENFLLSQENSENTVASDVKRNSLSLASPDEFVDGGEPIIGRRREIAEIKNLLSRGGTKLVTLTGAGGTGKTRLARAVGEELTTHFADGVFFVELASVTDAEFLAPAITAALGVKDSSGVTLVESLKRFLRERRTLLILDNFEQLIRAASLLKELLNAALSLKILVTSRVALRLHIEQESVVAPLAVPPRDSAFSSAELTAFASVNLFVARAQNAKPNFSLTEENSAAVAEICHKLDGLPLAIELAAVRVKLLSPQAIFERLENSLQLLTGGAKDLPPRQRTMRGAIQWSYDLLDEDEKVLFRQLAVFIGGFTVQAAEAVVLSPRLSAISSDKSELDIEDATPPEGGNQNDVHNLDILNSIASLINNNLLALIEQTNDNVRFRMLEVVREFAFEQLQTSGELEFLQRSHARHFLTFAEEAEPHLTGEKSIERLEKLETEIDNLRAALRWSLNADTETAIRLAAALRYFWSNHSYLREGREWLEATLERSGDASPVLRFKLLNGIGQFARNQGDYAAAQKIYEEGLAAGEAANDLQQIVIACHGLAALATRQGDFPTARKYNEQELAISREIGDEAIITVALASLGDLSIAEGDTAAARPLIEESLEISRRLGNKQVVITNLVNLGAVAYRERDWAAAYTHFTESLTIAQELGNKAIVSCSLDGFAALAAGSGNVKQAALLSGAAEQLRSSIGYEIELTERRFRDVYLKKVRAALDEKSFVAHFEKGKVLDLSEAVAFVLQQSSREDANGGYPNADGEIAEIIIEKHSFSRILIEED